MYYCQLGVYGAAISTVISQYVFESSSHFLAFDLVILTLGSSALSYLKICSHDNIFILVRYIVTFLMIWHLNKRAVLLPPKLGELQFGGYLKSGKNVVS